MDFPQDRKYQKTHEWVQIQGNVAVVGITDYAQEELGDIVFVELPDAGKELKKGDEITVIESVKTTSSIYSPCAGKVKEVNGELENKPELINQDAHAVFIVKIELSGECDQSDLLDSQAYAEVVEKEQQE